MFDNSEGMEWFLIFIIVFTIYLGFEKNIYIGLTTLLINIWLIPKFNWKKSKTKIGKFLYKNIFYWRKYDD